MHKRFEHKDFEKKWQDKWSKDGVYATNNESDKPRTYVLDMFPYPSGEGLHVGHPKGYIATDIYSRFKRMSGYEVLHPMGWDAFGLPAENFAIKHKVHPREAVEQNIANFKSQLGKLGFDYDWDREINTTDPAFYKWTQWIFLQLFKKGLAYESHEPINWCPGCQTGLANEDLESDGTCERCDSAVEKKPMRQWVLNIRAYADRMLEDLDTLEWPEHIKEAQRNWIGRSEGAEIDFKLSTDDTVTVFTTRPDTLFGATYMVLAPEHPLVQKHKDSISNWAEVETYIKETANKKEMDRLDDTKEKTGVKLEGITATNPANDEKIPVFIADYVLAGYGTGAIMAVPAHDERDFEFANKFDIKIWPVVFPKSSLRAILVAETFDDKRAVIDELHAAHIPVDISTSKISKREHLRIEFDEPKLEQVVEIIQKHIQNKNWVEILGAKNLVINKDSVNYNFLNDSEKWFDQFKEWEPLLKDQKNLWDLLSKNDFFAPYICYKESGKLNNSGEFDGMDSEEAKQAITEKVGGRMTKTYKIKDWVFSRQRYWGEPIPIIHCEKCGPMAVPEEQLPVTLPDVEHYEPAGDGQSPLATIDEWVNTECPECGGVGKRETNTMPQWAGSSWYYLRYMDPKNDTALVSKDNEKAWAPVDVYVGGDHAVRHLIYARFWHKFLYDEGVVSTLEPFQRLEFLGFILAEDGRKMSKRWGNVINPDDIVDLVGADTLRIYEMFMGPFENTIAWSQDGLAGARRFLERVNGLREHVKDTETEVVTRQLHKTIKKVAEDIEGFKFNTAVSAMMIFVNVAEKEGLSRESYKAFLLLLAPFAPHMTEELWSNEHESSVHLADFPDYNDDLAKDDEVTIGVQINGKLRGDIVIAPNADEATAVTAAHDNEKVAAKLADQEIIKTIYVPGRILNFIVRPQ